MIASLVMVRAPVVGRPAPVLHGRLIALARLAPSFARTLVATHFQSVPLLPRPKKKMLLAASGTDLKTRKCRPEKVQRVSTPPVDAQSPSSFVVESSLLTAAVPYMQT